MDEMDQSFETAQNIYNDYIEFVENIRTEEDTKIQLINRLLTECLGWLPSDISAETHHDNGYSDYILSNHGAPSFLIEAKRIGLLEINTAEKERVRHLKISGPGLSKVMDGIDQAASYAMPNGFNIAILTDGDAWIVFKTFITGEHFKNKEAIVFPSFKSIITDFHCFYDILSKKQFGKKLYNSIFDQVHQRRIILTQELKAPLEDNDIKISQKSDLAFDLDKVFSSFFSKLTGDEDEDLLVECFVESRESRIADFSLEKMTANVLGNIAPVDKAVDAELASLIQTNIDIRDGATESGQTVFIVGPTGAGKTTFLDRFFKKTLSRSVRQKCVLIKVNCLDSSGSEETALKWLTEELISSLEAEVYDDGIPSWGELQGLYHGEYLRRSIGVDAHLYSRDKNAFKEKFGDYLNEKVETDREGYLKRILTDVVTNRKMLPIFLIDNTDEFSGEYKKSLFQFVQSLRRHANHCIAIFPVTDKSAWSFSKTDIYGIYKSRSFFLPTPSPREVFRKRINFLQQHLSGDLDETQKKSYFSDKNIKISIEHLSGFAHVLENTFVDHDYTSKTIGELSNYNIRRTLALSQRVITSSVFKIEDLIKSYITSEPIATNFSKFMDALLKGDYEAYKAGDTHEIYPIFKIDNEAPSSPLLNLRILTLLDSIHKGSRTVDEQHLSVQSIVDYFDALGTEEASVDKTLISLLDAKLIEPYDVSIQDLSADQKLAISYSGMAHLRLASRNSVFFYQMALTTAITDPETVLIIQDSYKSKIPFSTKIEKIREAFYKYLVAEDQKYISNRIELDQYNCQTDLLKNLKVFTHTKPDENHDLVATLGTEYKEGLIKEGTVATVDWFSSEKKFGFVEVEGFEMGLFLHSEIIKEYNDVTISDGDEILCDISRNHKGFYVSKIHDIQTDISLIETKSCYIARLFPEREYGFVTTVDSEKDAFFHFSLVDEQMKQELSTGTLMTVEIVPDKRGRGLQVKKIISIDS